MNALIKSALILDNKSDFHNKTQDILIEDGIITKIANSLKNTNNFQVIQYENLHVSQGWFDSSVCFGEPGYEDRETIKNGLKVAANSGFTAVALQPNNYPVMDSRSAISYTKTQSNNTATTLFPVGALTLESKGVHLAEIFDMNQAGSIAFGDYKESIDNPNILKIGLQYASSFGGLLQSFPQDSQVAQSGVMNENISSTKLGLKGIPELAEALQIVRDLDILEYTGGKLHIPTISTAKSVELIRRAKAKGLDVSCSVAIHNLIFKDSDIKNYNTNFKVIPPLRTQNAIDALIEGLKDGSIDMVTSDHNPIAIEDKKVEFDYAAFGTIGLESAFGALNTVFSTQKAIELLTKGKSRFGIENTEIKVGNRCDLTLYNPKGSYTFESKHIASKSKNSIFIGRQLKGSVYGVIANQTAVLK